MSDAAAEGLWIVFLLFGGLCFAMGWFICKSNMLAKIAKWEQDED